MCVVDDNAITGCIAEKRQAISPATKEQQIPYLTDCARKRLELFQIFGEGRQRVSLLHASRRNRQQRQHTSKGRRDTLPAVTLMEANTRCSAALPETPYAFAMVKSNAQRQAEYQRRQQEAGSYRLDAYISPDAHAALQQVVQRDGISRKDAIERSILNEAKGRNMQRQFRTDHPVSQPARQDTRMTTTKPTPARPSEMTVAEHQELMRFKESLPNAIINAEQEARHVQANGGAAAMSQKERAAASFLASNIHRK